MKYYICLLISLNFVSSNYATEIYSIQKKKAYIVKDNFVKIGNSSSEFVCALYRNYNGWGGKKSKGWLLKSNSSQQDDSTLIVLGEIIGLEKN